MRPESSPLIGSACFDLSLEDRPLKAVAAAAGVPFRKTKTSGKCRPTGSGVAPASQSRRPHPGPSHRHALFEGLRRFARTSSGDVTALHGDMAGAFRLRPGDYRVLFAFQGTPCASSEYAAPKLIGEAAESWMTPPAETEAPSGSCSLNLGALSPATRRFLVGDSLVSRPFSEAWRPLHKRCENAARLLIKRQRRNRTSQPPPQSRHP